jgi:glycosyltransferase involved in cell wall biosynthesis
MTERPLDVLVVAGGRVGPLSRCLSSLREHLGAAQVRVWVGPDDGPAVRGTAADHPEVDWIFAEAEVPYATAVNRLVGRSGHDVLLLRPDAEVTGPLHRTRAALQGERVAAVSPTLVRAAGPQAPWDVALRAPTVSRMLVEDAGHATRLRGARWSARYPAPPVQVDGRLAGPALFVPRAAWEGIGPLDERFFPAAEEWEWQRRGLEGGWRLLLVDEREILHEPVPPAGDPAGPDLRARDLQRINAALALGFEGNRGRGALLSGGQLLIERVQRSKRRARAREAAAETVRAGGRHAVVITTPRMRPAGAERQRVSLANELVRRGHPVTIVCLQNTGSLVHELDPRVRLALRPWWQPVVDVPGDEAVLVSGTTNIEVGFAAAWSRGRGRRRWLVAAHEFPRSGPAYSRPLAAAIRGSDGVIALSELHWESLNQHQDVHERHFCIPNGVPLQTDRGYRPGEPLRLAFLGRIVEFKNPHLLVDALAQLREFGWRLDIFGDGPDRARLEALVPDSVRDRVHWHGRVPGPDQAFAGSDVLCMPTRHDAYPLVALEAMARGVPVIASAIGGLPEMLGDGEAGVLVPQPTLEEWVGTLREVLRQPEALKAVARAGWERVRTEYSVSVMAERYQAAMADALTAG